MYEIFVYMSIIPYVSSARWKLSQGQEAFPIYQHYTVTHANGTEKIEQNVNLTSLGIPASDDAAWISLGRFKLDSGIHRVNLSDKGNISDFYIYADAVKWVYLEDND